MRKQTEGGGTLVQPFLLATTVSEEQKTGRENDYLPPCARTWTRQCQETAFRNLVALTSSLQSKPSPKDRTEVERRDRTGGDMCNSIPGIW